MKTQTFFVDTNLFLQCLPLEELPWKDVSDNENIQLVIARIVRNEIDRLKQDGNTRRAKRARTANSLFKRILQAGDNGLYIKSEATQVRVILGPNFKRENLDHEELDLTQNDHLLIAEALAFSKQFNSTDVCLLTHDVNPLFTARQVGLKSINIPDSWLLPPEKDSRDTRIATLEAQIKKLENQMPSIQISWDKDNDSDSTTKIFEIPYFPALSRENISFLLKLVESTNPMETNFFSARYLDREVSEIVLPFIIQPIKEEIDRYQNIDYPNWLKRTEEFFQIFHDRLNSYFMRVELMTNLSNIGTVPANHLLLNISVYDGLLIDPPSKNKMNISIDDINIKLPKAPVPPKPRLSNNNQYDDFNKFNNLIDIDRLKSIGINKSIDKDRYAFYWKPERPSKAVDTWEFECEEFRHKLDPEIFKLILILPRNKLLKHTVVKCLLTASNMPSPFVQEMHIDFKYLEKDTMEIAQKTLKDI